MRAKFSRVHDRLIPLIFRIQFIWYLKALTNYEIAKCQRLFGCQGNEASMPRDRDSSNSFLCSFLFFPSCVFPVHPVQRRRMRLRQEAGGPFQGLLYCSIHSSCMKSVHYRFCKQKYTKMTTRLIFFPVGYSFICACATPKGF